LYDRTQVLSNTLKTACPCGRAVVSFTCGSASPSSWRRCIAETQAR
jgi:hypothetical protein